MISSKMITALDISAACLVAIALYFAWRFIRQKPMGKSWTIRLSIASGAYNLLWWLSISRLLPRETALKTNPIHSIFLRIPPPVVERPLQLLHITCSHIWDILLLEIMIVLVATGVSALAGACVGAIVDLGFRFRIPKA